MGRALAYKHREGPTAILAHGDVITAEIPPGRLPWSGGWRDMILATPAVGLLPAVPVNPCRRRNCQCIGLCAGEPPRSCARWRIAVAHGCL